MGCSDGGVESRREALPTTEGRGAEVLVRGTEVGDSSRGIGKDPKLGG